MNNLKAIIKNFDFLIKKKNTRFNDFNRNSSE